MPPDSRFVMGIARFVLLCLLLVSAVSLLAQTPAPADDASATPESSTEDDPLGRNTPRGTFVGYIDAVSVQDYERAAEYLDLSHLAEHRREAEGQELAQRLQVALDRGGNVPPAVMLSEDEAGRRGDNLDPRHDRLGVIRIGEQEIDVLVERTEHDDQMLWLVSSETLEALPAILQGQNRLEIEDYMPEGLERLSWQGVSAGHWLAIIILVVLAYLVSYMIVAVLWWMLHLGTRGRLTDYGEGMLAAFVLPLRIYLAVLIFAMAGQYLGIAIVVRQYFGEMTVIVAWAAILLLTWRLITVISDVTERQIIKRNNIGALSALQFFRRGAKIIVLVVGTIIVLDTLGFDVTTGLAALGIGGLAVALGAQKTIENLVGSLTLIFDQPVRVGDFCSVGESSGVVEQIGMRSSRLRTADRSLVVIPNSEFAAHRIENFAHRDRFRFSPILNLRYETTPDQMRWLLVEIRSLLYAHPKVDPDPARVRFIGLGEGSLQVELFAYVLGKSFDDFLEIQEDLYLRIMEVIDNSGTSLALGSHTLYHAQDSGLSSEKKNSAEAEVQEWRSKDELNIPTFDPKRITELRRRIVYPPEGSSAGKKR